MKVQWKNPPEVTKGVQPTFMQPELVVALKSRRGQWARIYGPKPYPVASLAVRAKSRTPGLEVVSRKEADGYYLYARYIGNGARK